MANNNIVITVTADSSSLDATIEKLAKLGLVDGNTAKSMVGNAAQVQTANNQTAATHTRMSQVIEDNTKRVTQKNVDLIASFSKLERGVSGTLGVFDEFARMTGASAEQMKKLNETHMLLISLSRDLGRLRSGGILLEEAYNKVIAYGNGTMRMRKEAEIAVAAATELNTKATQMQTIADEVGTVEAAANAESMNLKAVAASESAAALMAEAEAQEAVNLAQKASGGWIGLAIAGIAAFVGVLYAQNKATEKSFQDISDFRNKDAADRAKQSHEMEDVLRTQQIQYDIEHYRISKLQGERDTIYKDRHMQQEQIVSDYNKERAALDENTRANRTKLDELKKQLELETDFERTKDGKYKPVNRRLGVPSLVAVQEDIKKYNELLALQDDYEKTKEEKDKQFKDKLVLLYNEASGKAVSADQQNYIKALEIHNSYVDNDLEIEKNHIQEINKLKEENAKVNLELNDKKSSENVKSLNTKLFNIQKSTLDHNKRMDDMENERQHKRDIRSIELENLGGATQDAQIAVELKKYIDRQQQINSQYKDSLKSLQNNLTNENELYDFYREKELKASRMNTLNKQQNLTYGYEQELRQHLLFFKDYESMTEDEQQALLAINEKYYKALADLEKEDEARKMAILDEESHGEYNALKLHNREEVIKKEKKINDKWYRDSSSKQDEINRVKQERIIKDDKLDIGELKAKEQRIQDSIDLAHQEGREVGDLEKENLKIKQDIKAAELKLDEDSFILEKDRNLRIKKEISSLVDSYKFMADQIIKVFENIINENIKYIDHKEQLQTQSINQQVILASQGKANTLAYEQKTQNDLEARRAQEQKKLVRAKELEVFLNSVAAFSKTDPKTALPKALAEVALMKAIEGTYMMDYKEEGGVVGKGPKSYFSGNGLSRRHASGNDILLHAERGEGVLSVKEMNNLGENNFNFLKDMLKTPLNEKILPNTKIVSVQQDNSKILDRLESLENTIRNKKETHIDWESFDRMNARNMVEIENGIKTHVKNLIKKPRI